MLTIHRSERADGLIAMLGDLVAEPLADPFTAEVVAVPTRGVERWVTQQLAGRLGSSPGRGDGVCANIDFPFPGRLIGAALAAACGIEPDRDPWAPERSVWPLLEVVGASLGEEWLGPLAAHLEGETGRFATVRHIADLYDRYAVHRPDMLRRWAGGDDEGLAPDSRWQSALWRQLRRRIDRPSPAERLVDACARLKDQPELVDLPDRLSLFGLTRLAASYLDVLEALAARRQVHLFLLHPSPALWSTARAAALSSTSRGLPQRSDPTADIASNPLLASWGRDAREMQLVLGGAARTERRRPIEDAPATLLGRIQADVRADRAPEGVPLPGREDHRPLLDRDDRSVEIHACHGRYRQVEVLRDAILHVLNDDQTLEQRDVIVMCPDIETYAPLIQAVFGATEGDDGEQAGEAAVNRGRVDRPDLRVRLADRSLRQTNPVLGVVAAVLDLAAGRVTATQVLDLAGRPPVRRRFGFDDDDLSRLEEWVAGAGIRWGLDAEHRKPWKLDRLDANTWRAGLDRMLLGVAMADEGQRLFGGVLPLDEVDSGDIELVGRFAELLDRLQHALDSLTAIQPLAQWVKAIGATATALCSTSNEDTWQTIQFQRLLNALTDEATSTDEVKAGGAINAVPITIADIRAILADRLKGRPTRANFRTGHLTVCTLVPMRSVPHRVVCLLGLDDAAFPRNTERDGDDLTQADPWVGDRDARSEDRQLLLDALLAATDRLVITYAGRDERTNIERPPAVPVGELLDVIDRTVRTGKAERPAREQVVVRHPLQPFDARNFLAGELVDGAGPWSFDGVYLDGAKALSRPAIQTAPFLPSPLSDIDTTIVELDQLERFVRHPVRTFLAIRLGLRLFDRSRELDDALPVELDALQQWGVGERLLAALMAGADRDASIEAELARGLLPPGALADPILNKVVPVVEELVTAAHDDWPPSSLDVRVALPDATSVVGTVAGVRGDVVHTVTYSRLGANHRLLAWVRLLALASAYPDRAFEACTIGRCRDSRSLHHITVARIAPLGSDVARKQLADLVDLFRKAMREPVPLYSKTSAAWAEARRRGKEPAWLADKEWKSAYNFDHEDRDPEHLLVLAGGGEPVALEELLSESPRPDESGDGWAADETTRLGRYARRLWDGLLSHEQIVDR